MTLTLLNVIYVLLAIAMIGFILVQRGAGAQAGSGFGGGASATVFGARGAGNFLTKSTAVLAAVFFVLSLGMGIYVARSGIVGTVGGELGVMSDATTEEAPAPVAAPAGDVPAATDVPAAAAPGATPAAGDVPAAPEAAKPEAETPKDGPER
jgi:preprotein translocase subunit SecG